MNFALQDAFQRGWLVVLVILWAGLLFGGFALGHLNRHDKQGMPTWTRIGSSCILVVLAWSLYGFTRVGVLAPFSLLIALGMSLGWIGDIALAELLPVPQPLLLGLCAFGIGHISYIAAFIDMHVLIGHTVPFLFLGGIITWLLIGIIAWYLIVIRGNRITLLHRLALPYTLLLAGTAGLTTGLATQSTNFVLVALGAACFFCSDLILAAQVFKHLDFPFIQDAIWLTYGPGQFLILYSIYGALLLVK
jgi:hypothetical protein